MDRGSLRQRLTVAIVTLTATAAILQGASYWFAQHWVDDQQQRELLDHELTHLLVIDVSSTDDVPESAMAEGALRYFRSDRGPPPPAELQRLPAGWTAHLTFEGRRYQALVRDLAAGQRAWLLHDSGALDERDHRLTLMMSLGVVLVCVAAAWLSSLIAARTLLPLDRLVAAIRALRPESAGGRLALAQTGELRVIAEAVNALLAEIDLLIERERLFAAAASHELRTPLAVIGGAAEVLAATGGLAAAPLARIDRAVQQARLDLEALLALSRDKRVPAPQSVDASVLLPAWAEPYLTSLQSPPALEWRIADARLEVAPDSLRIVFTNLLRNALRAAGPAGRVTVTLDADVLRVIDDGPGIPVDELPRVFEPHVSGHHGGTGIGLYIARTLALRHGWALGLANRADARGAVAELVLSKP